MCQPACLSAPRAPARRQINHLGPFREIPGAHPTVKQSLLIYYAITRIWEISSHEWTAPTTSNLRRACSRLCHSSRRVYRTRVALVDTGTVHLPGAHDRLNGYQHLLILFMRTIHLRCLCSMLAQTVDQAHSPRCCVHYHHKSQTAVTRPIKHHPLSTRPSGGQFIPALESSSD